MKSLARKIKDTEIAAAERRALEIKFSLSNDLSFFLSGNQAERLIYSFMPIFSRFN